VCCADAASIASTLEVGPTKAFKMPTAAASIAKDGDVVLVDPRTYYDCAV